MTEVQLADKHELHPQVQEALRDFPTLSYLLGRVEPAYINNNLIFDERPDNKFRPVSFLKEGSGMFGLTDRDDALRWRGIFNHIMGSARQIFYLAERLAKLTPQQKQQFAALGYDLASFDQLDPNFLRDFMFISHAGRRQMDEYNWHDLRDGAHPGGNSEQNTVELLRNSKADPRIIDLMRVETHVDYLAKEAGTTKILPNIVDNVYSYSDWTFGQKPNTLTERFKGLRESKRAPANILDLLEACGNSFEQALKNIVSPTIFEEMTQIGPYDWETQIRQAYCASAGLKFSEVFPTIPYS